MSGGGGERVITNVRQTLLTMGWVGCNLTHVETEFEEKFDQNSPIIQEAVLSMTYGYSIHSPTFYRSVKIGQNRKHASFSLSLKNLLEQHTSAKFSHTILTCQMNTHKQLSLHPTDHLINCMLL